MCYSRVAPLFSLNQLAMIPLILQCQWHQLLEQFQELPFKKTDSDIPEQKWYRIKSRGAIWRTKWQTESRSSLLWLRLGWGIRYQIIFLFPLVNLSNRLLTVLMFSAGEADVHSTPRLVITSSLGPAARTLICIQNSIAWLLKGNFHLHSNRLLRGLAWYPWVQQVCLVSKQLWWLK